MSDASENKAQDGIGPDRGKAPGLPRRVAAMVYDGFLVIPLIMGVVALATAVGVAVTGDPGDGDYSATLPPFLVQSLALSCVVGFYCYFWRLRGQTLGMQAWRLQLVGDSGDKVSLRQSLTRCAAAFLSFAPAGLGYVWCLIDSERLCWHDRLSGTHLRLVPKPSKKQ
ncbi:MAG: RDD family protein [Pseudomonadota bacterium]